MRRVQSFLIPFLVGALVMVTVAFGLYVMRPGPTVASVDAQTLQSSVPSLTAAQKQQIVNIAEGDQTVRQLVAGHSYQPTGTVVWTMQEGSLLGGVVTLTLSQPAAISGTWLDLDYDCSERASPPYGRQPYLAAYTNVSSIIAFVDLQKKQVAGISPKPELRHGVGAHVVVGSVKYLGGAKHLSDSCRD